MIGRTKPAMRYNIWEIGLYTLISLFYLGAFMRSMLAWLPFGIIILLMIKDAPKLASSFRDLLVMRWFIVLIIWTFLSVVWSSDQESTFTFLRNLIPKLVILFFAFNFPLNKTGSVYFLGIMITGIVCVLGLFFIVKFGAIRISYEDKLFYEISYANLIASAIVVSMPLILFNMKRRLLSFSIFIIILSAYVIIMTESRAGIILYVVAFVFSFAFAKSIKFTRPILAVFFFFFLLTIGYDILRSYYPETADRIDTISDTLLVFYNSNSILMEGDNDYTRKMQVLYTIDEVKRIPILGIGYGAFASSIDNAYGIRVAAHSFLGTFFVELGLVGFVVFVVFNLHLAFLLLRKSNDQYRKLEARNARMAFTAFVLANLLFFSRPQMAEVTYFVVIGLAMAAVRPQRGRGKMHFVSPQPHRK